VGNLPYYSQIPFALADASHSGAVDCATVSDAVEVAQRMVAKTETAITVLFVVFQLYADTNCHFKIPPRSLSETKGGSGLGKHLWDRRDCANASGVKPSDLRRSVGHLQQRRKIHAPILRGDG
jgi:hypothetical protein